MTLDLALLASGSGSNARAIFQAAAEGILDANVRLLVCNRPEAGVLELAKQFGIASLCLDHKLFPSREAFDARMAEAILQAGADTVAMAGYMRLVTPLFLHVFKRVLNIHPAVLPSFPGVSAGRAAVEYGVRFSGCTVHFVSEEMDAGPVIIQAVTPVRQTDTEESLMARVHPLEHRIYPQALQWLAQNRLSVQGHTVMLKDGGVQPSICGDAMIYPPLEGGFAQK